MQSGLASTYSQSSHANLSWLGISTLLLVGLPSVYATEFGPLSITSTPGKAFTAELVLSQVGPDTDLNCFSVNSQASSISLEYTTLGNQQGLLTLWSEQPIVRPTAFTLRDHCQPSQHRLTVQPDLTVSTTTPSAAVAAPSVEVASPEPAVQLEHHAMTPPAVPLEAYTSLQTQIGDLQQGFKQLQAKSDALYASNLAQANILATLKTQLVQLQNENHLLRSLVMALGLTLIGSGFFFADWLRRHAAVPKSGKSRQPSGKVSVANPATLPPFSQSGMHTPTQPPLATTQAASSRLKSVPMHANDDAVTPHLVPHKLSSQQSTQTVMQDASRLFTHGRVNQAIEHLQQHLAKHPKCSPWMWLYLLDLLSKEGKQQEFDIVASECRKHFNLNVEHAPDLKQQGIESFPRVMKALQQAWGTPQVIALIDDLVYNTRLVPRMGFERTVFEDLMLLKEIACQTQNLPAVPPAPKAHGSDDPANSHLRELQQLSEDIYVLAPVEHTPFQYWTDFTFELDESSSQRKSA